MDKRLTGNARAQSSDGDQCHTCGSGEGSFELMWVNAQVDAWPMKPESQCSGGNEARGMTGRESGPVASGRQGEHESERMCLRKAI